MTALRLRYQTLEFGNEDLHVRSLRPYLETPYKGQILTYSRAANDSAVKPS